MCDMYRYRFGSGRVYRYMFKVYWYMSPENAQNVCFLPFFHIFPSQTNSILHTHIKTISYSSCNLNYTQIIFRWISFFKNSSEFTPKNLSNMRHNPYTYQIPEFVGFCSNPNSFTLQLNHESNLKERIPCFSCTIWGFTHLTLNNLWVMMKSYQNPRKIKCQQETHVGMNFYQTLGLGQATNHMEIHTRIHRSIQKSKVPYH